MSAAETGLPGLRRDLVFRDGPADETGAPTRTVFDPISGRYCKLGWAEAAALRLLRRGMTSTEWLENIRQSTTVRPTAQELSSLLTSAAENSLLDSIGSAQGKMLEQAGRAGKMSPVQWLLAHYLFFKIPLLRPEKFLRETVGAIRLLASPVMLRIHFLAACLGLLLVSSRAELYWTTFQSFLTLPGLISYGIAIIFIKSLHEFSHAYVATNYGVRVRSMGIAFMVFWPIPFCDVTDVWQLSSRRQRFIVGLAGVGAELALAGWALLFWVASPPGVWQSVWFLLSSGTLVSTFIVNMNPAMRFDGYYLLMDFSGVENLQRRAFALTKWKLRQAFLGLRLPPPETVSARRLTWMMAYSVYTWLYRFFLYLGIAVLVYYKFTKALGIFLFLTEIWLFIARPAVNEFGEIFRMKNLLTFNTRLLMTLLALSAFALWLTIPLERTFTVPGVVIPQVSQTLYVPAEGTVSFLRPLQLDEKIAPGELLLKVDNPQLETDLKILRSELACLDEEIKMLGGDGEDMAFWREKLEEREKIKLELAEKTEVARQNSVDAAQGGIVAYLNPDLLPGQAVKRNTVVATLISPQKRVVVAYLPEQKIGEIKTGASVSFVNGCDGKKYAGKIGTVNRTKAERMAFAALMAEHGGNVVGKKAGESFMPSQPYYEIRIVLDENVNSQAVGTPGFIIAETEPVSYLANFGRRIWGVLLRESGF
jgi:putative peptide zinc metalloprotease protein